LVTIEKAARLLGVTPKIATARLRRLVAQGWLTRAQRGVYLIRPLEAGGPSTATTVEDPWVLAHELFAPCYIGGWSAAEHWELTEQLFRSTFVVSAAARRRASETRLATEFRVARVPPPRVESVGEIWRGSVRMRVSDRERTIADGLMHPVWLGGMRHIVEMLRTYGQGSHFQPQEILGHLKTLDAGAGTKRLGFLAEHLWPAEKELVERALANRSSGIVKLDPTVADAGPVDSRWGLRINIDVEEGSV
jgi:predicted transcriptional regulator of viral defense system